MMKSKDGYYVISIVQTSRTIWKLEAYSFGAKMRSATQYRSKSKAEADAAEIAKGTKTVEWVVRKS